MKNKTPHCEHFYPGCPYCVGQGECDGDEKPSCSCCGAKLNHECDGELWQDLPKKRKITPCLILWELWQSPMVAVPRHIRRALIEYILFGEFGGEK